MNQTEEMIGGTTAAPNVPNLNGLNNSAQNAQASTQQVSGQSDAPDYLVLARKIAVATALSAEGNEYVKQLKTFLKEKSSILGAEIKVINLSSPHEALAVCLGNDAFVLLFSEVAPGGDTPTSALTKEALENLMSIVGRNVKMRNAIVVTPDMYSRGAVMAAHLINCFALLSNGNFTITLDSMRKYQLEISTNVSDYENFNRKFNPHGVIARDDIKITLAINTPKKTQDIAQNFFAQSEVDKTEICTIACYTNFLRGNTFSHDGIQKYIPEVHISEIVSAIPFQGVIPLALAIVSDFVVAGGHWKTQFTNLDALSPNIGNLFSNAADGAPIQLDNLAVVNQYLSSYFENPVLIMDVVEGRARIPGIEQYVIQNSNGYVTDTINKFLGLQTGQQNAIHADMSNYSVLYKAYVGDFQQGSDTCDTRWVDYLNMMIHHRDRNKCASLLERFPENLQLTYLKSFVDARPQYLANMVAFSYPFINSFSNIIKNAVRVNSNMNNNQSISAGAWYGFSAGFAMGNTSTPYAQINPFANIYNRLF